MVAKGERGGGGKNWESGISRGKLLYIGWINNKVLLYSTGNYIQYPVTNHDGKAYEYILCIYIYIYVYIYIYIYIRFVTGYLNIVPCVCITESLCCTEEMTTSFIFA